MKRHWTIEELQKHWELLSAERRLVEYQRGRHDRLGFAVLLKFFQSVGRFPHHRNEIPAEAVAYLDQQLVIPIEHYKAYSWSGRSIKRHRAEIRKFLKFREATAQDVKELMLWLCEKIVPEQRQMEALLEAIYGRCRTQHIEPPTLDRIQRLIRMGTYSVLR